jgi:hypothetical protein
VDPRIADKQLFIQNVETGAHTSPTAMTKLISRCLVSYHN